MPSRKSVHTKLFDDCVKAVKRKGIGNPYAICMKSLGYEKSVKKGHRRK